MGDKAGFSNSNSQKRSSWHRPGGGLGGVCVCRGEGGGLWFWGGVGGAHGPVCLGG